MFNNSPNTEQTLQHIDPSVVGGTQAPLPPTLAHPGLELLPK